METRSDNPPNGRTASGDGTKKLGRRIEKVGHTAEHVWDRTRDSFSEMGDALDVKGRVRRHPYGTVAAAIGIGYVLGGGLFTPLTSRIVRFGIRLGMRLAVLPLIKQEMAALVEDIDEDAKVSKTNANKGRSAMNLKELRNFDKDDILEMMGLQTKTSTGAFLAGTLGTFGVGLLIGAGLGLLLAPKPGRELREDLRDRFRRIPGDSEDAVAAMGGRESSPNASKPY